ncbi:hypothetical protein [Mycobacterium sp.]|nr:hypothetical protein [Mycobacterium sp.]HTY31422.1 hypothetical protein [Mycobacterium sp.]
MTAKEFVAEANRRAVATAIRGNRRQSNDLAVSTGPRREIDHRAAVG